MRASSYPILRLETLSVQPEILGHRDIKSFGQSDHNDFCTSRKTTCGHEAASRWQVAVEVNRQRYPVSGARPNLCSVGPDSSSRAVSCAVPLEPGRQFSALGPRKTTVGQEETVPTLGQLRSLDRAYRRLSTILFDDEAIPRINRQVLGITEAENKRVPCQAQRTRRVYTESAQAGTTTTDPVQRVCSHQECGRVEHWKRCFQNALPLGNERKDHGSRSSRQPEHLGPIRDVPLEISGKEATLRRRGRTHSRAESYTGPRDSFPSRD